MAQLSLPMAVFGPLASGADVRMLGQPSGRELSKTAARRIETLYYARWGRRDAPDQPYWTFLKLDDHYWGLAKTDMIAKGALGDLVVVAVALIGNRILDDIEWQTPQLWADILPARLSLPRPGSVLPPVAATFDPPSVGGTGSTTAVQTAFELESALSRSREARVRLIVPSGSAPEEWFARIWPELGRWASGVSYCTWDGIDAPGTRGASLDINAVAGRGPTTAARRLDLTGESVVRSGWYMRREEDCGLPGPARVAATLQNAESIAGHWFASLGKAIVASGHFGPVKDVPKKAPAKAFALPWLLERVVDSLGSDLPAAARMVDAFTKELLGSLEPKDGLQSPQEAVAATVLRHKLLLQLSPLTVHDLAPWLFGDADHPGPVPELESILDLGQSAGNGIRQDTAWEIATLLDNAPSRFRAKARLFGGLWRNDSPKKTAIEAWLDAGGDHIASLERYNCMLSSVPEQRKPAFVKDNAAIWWRDISSRIGGAKSADEAAIAYNAMFGVNEQLQG